MNPTRCLQFLVMCQGHWSLDQRFIRLWRERRIHTDESAQCFALGQRLFQTLWSFNIINGAFDHQLIASGKLFCGWNFCSPLCPGAIRNHQQRYLGGSGKLVNNLRIWDRGIPPCDINHRSFCKIHYISDCYSSPDITRIVLQQNY